MIVGVLLAANVFQIARLYDTTRLEALHGRPHRLFTAWSFVVLLVVALGFATKTAHEASRLWVGLWFVYGLVGLLMIRLLLRYRLRRWQRDGRLTRKLAVVGTDDTAWRLIEHLRYNADPAVCLIGLFDDRDGCGPSRRPSGIGGYPVLGMLEDLIRLGRNGCIDQVVVALPCVPEDRVLRWVERLRDLPVDVCLYPGGVADPPLMCRRVTFLGGVPLLNVVERPLSGWNHVIKAVEDQILAAILLMLAAPLMMLIALLIRLDSPGPVLFRQKRCGFNNEIIEVFKFRTMHAAAAEGGTAQVVQARRDDSRVTRVGRWLRRVSLDELPQLFNVLRGEMSIVGPRPHAVAHNEQYAPLIDSYLSRHRVKPGITGWAQVNGLRGETATLDKMKRRVQHDLYYIENWSLSFDLRILARTLLVGFVHPNAY